MDVTVNLSVTMEKNAPAVDTVARVENETRNLQNHLSMTEIVTPLTYPGSELNKSDFSVKRIKNVPAVQRYEVRKLNTALKWPDKPNMINFCDGGSNNWGGKVSYCGDIAWVDVYVD